MQIIMLTDYECDHLFFTKGQKVTVVKAEKDHSYDLYLFTDDKGEEFELPDNAFQFVNE